MKIKQVYIGGWFQRTTLHLTEVWDLLKNSKSELDFAKKDLQQAKNRLEISSLSREMDGLEYIAVTSNSGISFRLYEDGLIVLQKEAKDLKADLAALRDYYDNKLSKTISFIFSKGAPVPKELANIKTILPYIITTEEGSGKEVEKLFKDFKEEVYSKMVSKNVDVYRSPGIFVINNMKDQVLLRQIIESQIFFREFKTQLHRYLNIHRIIWEKIAAIKERKEIKGTEVGEFRSQLDNYQKTVTLIDARINQMGVYIRTRQKFADTRQIDDYVSPLFQYKFETLQDTHEYIKYLWDMTGDYLKSAIEVFVELENGSTKNSISALQTITAIGVVAGILGYLGKDSLPKFTGIGLFYFGLLLVMTYFLNKIISKFYKNKKYTISNEDIVKDIK